ncbi:S8 family peptidase [Agromyces laixinhei]|uniref:S8 family peptidase n=1 Tax=Agromyces laixinhei TaxID=2585717 RepID=UPI0018DEA543|nr:S8 family serine peptidase [Agromyces laixinhei]
MPHMRPIAAISILAIALTAFAAAPAGAAPDGDTAAEHEYVVLFTEDATSSEAHAAIEAAGGSIVSENTAVGVATVIAGADFATAADTQAVIEGTARNRVIGDVPDDRAAVGEARKADNAELDVKEGAEAPAESAERRGGGTDVTAEPLAELQWDMQQIGATADGSYSKEQGSHKVRVGIIDTGVDGTHPDIAPNFDAELSRNFTVDIPVDANGDPVDGPCEEEADQSCEDPADVDENGHGTHVASTIGSPINGIGIAGVAPQVSLVNLRAGQDSGYFFLQASVDALTYAGDNGIDVVNMSYYVDPWLFNCVDHPADSPEDQAEQQTVIAAMQRALDYARGHNVTLVAAAGNGATDYTKVISDAGSPDFASEPGEIAYLRDMLDPESCTSMPSEGKGVISVSSTGVSERKAYYSDYGNGYVDVAAPGGDVYDTPEGTRDVSKGILAAYPQSLAEANGEIDENGDPTVDYVVKSCDESGETCAYYQYLQGTSMASPHAVGVAALIVSRLGLPDWRQGGKFFPPAAVEALMKVSADRTACPVPADFVYTRNLPNGTVVTATHTCEGSRWSNGFYGKGIVNAYRAVGGR